jgi:hypothetical protein
MDAADANEVAAPPVIEQAVDEDDDRDDCGGTECKICFYAKKTFVSLKCGHVFCAACVNKALAVCERCPTCRAPAKKKDARRIFL